MGLRSAESWIQSTVAPSHREKNSSFGSHALFMFKYPFFLLYIVKELANAHEGRSSRSLQGHACTPRFVAVLGRLRERPVGLSPVQSAVLPSRLPLQFQRWPFASAAQRFRGVPGVDTTPLSSRPKEMQAAGTPQRGPPPLRLQTSPLTSGKAYSSHGGGNWGPEKSHEVTHSDGRGSLDSSYGL